MSIFNDLWQGFLIGNFAILTNACLLPLYPGLMAFLAGNANNERSRSITGLLGFLVLAGILSMMILIGFILSLLSASFGGLLTVLLPLIYGVVIVLGILMFMDRNPFTSLETIQAPMLKNPYVTAYVYGLLFGPMTLPCTGPIILSAFTLGTTTSSLASGLSYFIAFGLGFGWPLLVLPLLALPFQRQITGWLARQHMTLNRAAGILLITVGIFGIITELLPQIWTTFYLSGAQQLLYWGLVALLVAGVVRLSLQSTETPPQESAA